jgi:hypothetical protein
VPRVPARREGSGDIYREQSGRRVRRTLAAVAFSARSARATFSRGLGEGRGKHGGGEAEHGDGLQYWLNR